MIICSNCKAENPDGSTFCSTCGYDINPMDTPPPLTLDASDLEDDRSGTDKQIGTVSPPELVLEPLAVPQEGEPPNEFDKDETLEASVTLENEAELLPVSESEPPSQPKPDGKFCHECGMKNPAQAKFCSACGTKLVEAPTSDEEPTTEQEIEKEDPLEAARIAADALAEANKEAIDTAPKAMLVLVKGGESGGVTYNIPETGSSVGRQDGDINFVDDPFLSPLHASLYFENSKLIIEDQNSLNGVFVRIKAPVEIKSGLFFRVGNQLFKAESVNQYPPIPGIESEQDAIRFLGTPLENSKPTLKISQIMMTGLLGSVVYPLGNTLSMGREGCDLSYPTDPYISGQHAQLRRGGSTWYLTDLESRNGTYVKINEPRELVHGDSFFVGQQLFRVKFP